MPRKTKDCTEAPGEDGRAKGQDDRHLPHPHRAPADPAGGAVFDAGEAAPAADCTTPNQRGEDVDSSLSGEDAGAIGFVVLGDCPAPAGDDPAGAGDGYGFAVTADCETAAGTPDDAAASSPPAPRTDEPEGEPSTAVAPAARGLGFAVLPDGRVSGGADVASKVREGYGLVFPR